MALCEQFIDGHRPSWRGGISFGDFAPMINSGIFGIVRAIYPDNLIFENIHIPHYLRACLEVFCAFSSHRFFRFIAIVVFASDFSSECRSAFEKFSA